MPEEAPDMPPPAEEAPTTIMEPPEEIPETPAPDSELPPLLSEPEADKYQYQIVDESRGAYAEAIAHAESEISSRTSERGVKGFVKKIWFGNLARDYYRQKWIQEGLQEITERQDTYALDEASDERKQAATEALIKRVNSDYLHEGEANEDIEASDSGRQLSEQIDGLIRSFVRGEIDFEALEQEKVRVLSEYGQRVRQESGDRRRGLVYADNILEIAQNAKAAVEHEAGLERIDEVLGQIGGKIGEARTGVRTEAKLQAADKLIDWGYRHHLSGVNETTLAIAVGAGMTLAKFTTRKASSALGAFVGLGVGAGLIAGAREHLHAGQERALHMRQMAEGGEIEDGSKRREQMEETRYETVSARNLIDSLQAAREAAASGSPEHARALLALVTEAETRISLSDSENMDLIDYSGKTEVETERFELDLALAEAQTALRRSMAEGAGDLAWPGENPEELLSRTADECREQLLDDISSKDKAFSALRRKRVLKMAALGFVTGETLGLVFQELHSLADEGLQGVFEGSSDHTDRLSLLAGLLHHTGGHTGAEDMHRQFFEGGHHLHDVAVDLPKGYHMVDARPGEKLGWDLIGPNGKPVAQHLEWDTQGNLSHATRMLLAEKGFNLTQDTVNFHEPHTVTETVTRNVHEYLRAHPHEFTHVDRELWYDNNTPNIYDQNELRLWWGGPNGTGIDSHGDYVLNVSHMTPDGSFHDGLSTNAQELANGHKLALALSMTKDTQQYVEMVPVSANGNFIIPAHSFAAQALFESQGGQAHFVGAYAEVDQLMGQTPDGREGVRMLATLVGNNQPHSALDVVHHVVSQEHTHYVTNIEAPKHPPVEVPPVLPIYSRRGLEDIRPGEGVPPRPRPEGGGGNGRSYGYEDLQQHEDEWRADRSPRLIEDPDADLDTGEEVSWYRSQLAERRGQEYLDEVDANIENDPILKSIGEAKALVCIPVAAASESDNIYDTLSLYHQQAEGAKEATAIVLNINWQAADESDPEKKVRIDKTIAEVARAKTDFPDLKIASFTKIWSPEFVERRNGRLYGEVIKVLYDTAALSVERAVKEGRRRTDQEAVIITNDADALGMRNDYLERYINAMESNPQTDVFSGAIRWGTEQYRDYPGYGVVSGFYSVLSMMSLRGDRRKTGGVITTGPNAGFRLSTYAAIGGCEDRDDLGASADAVLGFRAVAARLAGRTGGSTRTISMHVSGAQIDSMPDRLLGAYKRGQWIADGWAGFNEGGYQDRTVSGNAGNLAPENIDEDIDDIAHRIEVNVAGFASKWYKDEALVDSALALFFGTTNRAGKPLYRLSKTGDGFQFRFTPEGRQTLKNMLSRDRRGRFDYYGSRVRRRLYNQVSAGARRQPKLENPLFVGHTG